MEAAQCDSELARSEPIDKRAGQAVHLAPRACICGSWVSDRGGLHGSRQLGDGHCCGQRLQLLAAIRRVDREFRRDLPPGTLREARDSRRARSGAGVSRRVSETRVDRIVVVGGDRDNRVRRGRSVGVSDSVEPAVSSASGVGSCAHRARRTDRTRAAAQGLPVDRDLRDHADRDDDDHLRARDHLFASRVGCDAARIHSDGEES